MEVITNITKNSMENKKLLITGVNGLDGSRIVELLAKIYTIETISQSSGVDITNRQTIIAAIKKSDATVVLHLAAKADVDGCEKDKALEKDGDAWKVNVEGTRNVVAACTESNKKILFISTDFVFGGDDTPKNGYGEEDNPNPVNWYAQTKYEGEKIVKNASIPWIIARIAYPYRANFATKKDFVRIFKSLLEQGKQLKLITDHINSATFIDDIASAIATLISHEATGRYHVTGSSSLSPYEQGLTVAKIFNLDELLIGKITREEFFKDRAARPFNLSMNNDKILALGVKMKTFAEGVQEVKNQIL